MIEKLLRMTFIRPLRYPLFHYKFKSNADLYIMLNLIKKLLEKFYHSELTRWWIKTYFVINARQFRKWILDLIHDYILESFFIKTTSNKEIFQRKTIIKWPQKANDNFYKKIGVSSAIGIFNRILSFLSGKIGSLVSRISRIRLKFFWWNLIERLLVDTHLM